MRNFKVEIDPVVEFKKELFAIKSHLHLGIVVEALDKVPDYYFFAPASSSGKYHPKSSLGIGGLIRHVKSVFAISEELLIHPLYAPFTDAEKDDIRVAILLHDTAKQGIEDTGTHTVTEHPLLVRSLLAPDTHSLDNKVEVEQAWDRICTLIETHMGPWTDDREGNKILEVPTTPGQLFVHLCDYLASRKLIEVDTLDRSAQANYAVSNEPVTSKQIEYIRTLMEKCIIHKIDSPIPEIKITDSAGKVIYTKSQASVDIGKLKNALGIF